MEKIIKITRSPLDGISYFIAVENEEIVTTCYSEKATIYTNDDNIQEVISKLELHPELNDYYIEAVNRDIEISG